jgi:hypothetical protein
MNFGTGHIKITLLYLILFLGLLLPAVAVLAQSGGYNLDWYTIDAGGHTFSSGGAYTLGGTIGQADAGVLAGGSYTLSGGFWGSGAVAEYHLYLPLVFKGGS